MLHAGVAEDSLDGSSQGVVGVADDHARSSLQGPEEGLPGGLILMRRGLKTPHRRDRLRLQEGILSAGHDR
jgi:hypothetical protein